MWYKTPNEELINLSLVTKISKMSYSDNNVIKFNLPVPYTVAGVNTIEVSFNTASNRDMEYNKILIALKTDKIKVII